MGERQSMRRNMGVLVQAALAAGLGQGTVREKLTPTEPLLAARRGHKGHTWTNKRRKLKKRKQDHQRPRAKRS